MAFIDQEFVDANILTPEFENALRMLPQEMKNKLIRGLTTAITQGQSIQDMAREIKKIMAQGVARSLLIARTETHRVIELAHNKDFIDARDQGVDTKMKLIATLDNRTRSQSAQMDGKLSNDEGKFKYPDENYYIPGNTGRPEWDINDRERAIQIIDDISPQLRRTREEGIIPFKTYRQWAKEKNLTRNIYGEVLF